MQGPTLLMEHHSTISMQLRCAVCIYNPSSSRGLSSCAPWKSQLKCMTKKKGPDVLLEDEPADE